MTFARKTGLGLLACLVGFCPTAFAAGGASGQSASSNAPAVLGILGAVAAAAILWALLLRRKLHGQTRNLRERLERETALEQQYREIFDGANDVIFTHDLEGRLTSLNPAGQRALGYGADEVKQLKMDQILAPEHRDHAREMLRTKLAAGEVVTCDCELVAKDGRRITVETSARLTFKAGQPTGVQAIARNITERKRVEEELFNSRQMLRTVLDTIPQRVFWKDRNSVYLGCNKPFAQDCDQADPAQLTGKTDFETTWADMAERYQADDRAVMESGRPKLNYEEPQTAPDGSQRWLKTSKVPLYDKDSQVIGVLGTYEDITAQKRAEAVLQQSELKFRSLVEESLVGVYIIQNGRFVYVNPRMAEIYGYTPEEIVQFCMVADLVAEEDQPLVLGQIQQRIAGELQTVHYSFRGRRKDGSVVFVEVLGHRSEYDGQPAVVGTLLDVSERKRAEKGQEATYRISQAAHTTRNLDDLYREIHGILGEMMPAKNFYLAVYDPTNDVLNFPYFVDQHDDDAPLPGKPGRGMTSYILRTGKAVHATPDVFKKLVAAGEVMQIGTPHVDWIGVPLKIEDRTVGVMAVQSYDESVHFDQKDIDLLQFVSNQVAMVIERKQTELTLAEASALLETLLENSPDHIYFKDSECRFVRYSKSFLSFLHLADGASLQGKTDFDLFSEEHARPAFEDEQAIMRTGQPMIGKLEKETHADGRVTWALTTKLPWRDKDGNIIGTFGISKEVTAIKEAEGKLAYERELFQILLENIPDAIYFKDRESHFVRVSRWKLERSLAIMRSQHLAAHPECKESEWPPHLGNLGAFSEYLMGKTDFDLYVDERARSAFDDEQQIIRTGEPIIGKLEYALLPDGEPYWVISTKMPWRDKDGNIIGTFGISRDITAVKQAEAELEAAHKRLLETSRLAGMAEVATDVLHNVGNVLNSVNVTCSLVIDRVKASKLSGLDKVSALLAENRGRLGEFLTADPRGQQVPDYLAALAEYAGAEQSSMLQELEQLLKHIDHIKQIVAMQQSYAKVAGVLEDVNPSQLLEDALHMNGAALIRHSVQVRREFADTPSIITDKHKVLQILVNLIRNAKYALDDSQRPDRLMTLKIGNDGDGHVKIQVVDNGVGIAAENLTRIFNHGFTTRRNGHGFGLHSSALAVRELGGSIYAESEGPGKGATFTLLLPHKPPTPTA